MGVLEERAQAAPRPEDIVQQPLLPAYGDLARRLERVAAQASQIRKEHLEPFVGDQLQPRDLPLLEHVAHVDPTSEGAAQLSRLALCKPRVPVQPLQDRAVGGEESASPLIEGAALQPFDVEQLLAAQIGVAFRAAPGEQIDGRGCVRPLAGHWHARRESSQARLAPETRVAPVARLAPEAGLRPEAREAVAIQ